MRDLIDMTVAAAFIRQENYYSKADWKLELFGDEVRFPVMTYAAPTQVETVVTSVWRGNQLMTPVGGGVTMHSQKGA